jgi:hypothetical protein
VGWSDDAFCLFEDAHGVSMCSVSFCGGSAPAPPAETAVSALCAGIPGIFTNNFKFKNRYRIKKCLFFFLLAIQKLIGECPFLSTDAL